MYIRDYFQLFRWRCRVDFLKNHSKKVCLIEYFSVGKKVREFYQYSCECKYRVLNK